MSPKFEIPNLRSAMCNSRLRRGLSGQAKGVALIIVLWIVTILSVIVLEFCFAMRTEINITKNFREEIQLYAIAEGGVQRAIAEMIYKSDPKIGQMRKALTGEEITPDQKEWAADGRPYSLTFDQGVDELRIMSEAGKVNINTVSENTLRKIINQLGLKEVTRDIIVDSILDWRDPGELHRVNGAKNDYYQSLEEPYNCKSGNLDAIEELLLVRGVTPELFYGRKAIGKGDEGAKADQIGLKDIFSIFSPGEQIDINSATLPVLEIVLAIPKEISERILKAREEKIFEGQQDLLQRVPDLVSLMGERTGLITYQSTIPYYTIESRAKSKEGPSVRGLKVIFKVDPAEKMGYKIIQWVDAL